MTFLEAAIEILRSADEPLHFKEIARLAVERKLLSHVGRDPEGAMQTCLNQAVRSNVHDGAVQRSKPGHYHLRAGAELPALVAPATAKILPDVDDDEPELRSGRGKKSSDSKTKAATSSKTPKASAPSKTTKASAPAETPPARKKRSRRRRGGRAEEVEREAASADDATEDVTAEDVTAEDGATEDGATEDGATEDGATEDGATEDGAPEDGASEDADDVAADEDDLGEDAPEPHPLERLGTHVPAQGTPPMPALDPNKVRFHGPEGSGLEGETDIALVMANAMSRLVDERPELREELEAMQKGQASVPEIIEVGRKKRREEEREREDDRAGRRRRRRRRKSKRVEWSDGGTSVQAARGQEVLDSVAEVLAESGGRSLHVRQIAEHLASQNVLGGEISEIERAVTAAILLDVLQRGEGSRFSVRGDARYQLRGGRLPEKAAHAEYAARRALHQLERETEEQLLLWLQSLGARSLESLVRMWLEREGYVLVATLPPARGLGKLIVDDPEASEGSGSGDDDDGRMLVLIVPRKTSLEPRLWDGEAERNNCGATMVFAMCEPAPELMGDARVFFAGDLARWLIRNGIGVRTVTFTVPVLDADLIESVAGLDT